MTTDYATIEQARLDAIETPDSGPFVAPYTVEALVYCTHDDGWDLVAFPVDEATPLLHDDVYAFATPCTVDLLRPDGLRVAKVTAPASEPWLYVTGVKGHLIRIHPAPSDF